MCLPHSKFFPSRNTLFSPAANPTKHGSPKLPFPQRQCKGSISPPGFLFLRLFAKLTVGDQKFTIMNLQSIRWGSIFLAGFVVSNKFLASFLFSHFFVNRGLTNSVQETIQKLNCVVGRIVLRVRLLESQFVLQLFNYSLSKFGTGACDARGSNSVKFGESSDTSKTILLALLSS